MRIVLFVATFFLFTAAKSQTALYGFAGYSQIAGLSNISAHDSLSSKKWFLSTYRGISTSVSFFNGNNATAFAAPMSVQLNRRINNNLYAFANLAIVPAFTNFNSPFLFTNTNIFPKNISQSNDFSIYPSASLGIMYVNDAKTFSISGSISAARSNYYVPYYPAIVTGQNQTTPQPRR